ncbi:hypothetical protein RDI58_022166 [Solanum bulbocastanum]|uniref:Uncharacterized protein n=1 Tax=Solanum bulbocastanum TaxID=147425 RepID=A0AAN8Y5J3_SOLBU
MKDNEGVSSPHIVDGSVEKSNVDPQPNSDNFYQQTISPMQMNFATVDHDVDVPAREVGKQKGSEENVAKDDGADTIQQDFEKCVSNLVVVGISVWAKPGYASDNDNPTRSKSDWTSQAEDGLINVE